MKPECIRIKWIDVARGIAILLVILGHCIGNLSDPGNRFILAFHMPLFFFLSGMCVSEKSIPIKDYLVKKVQTLLVPQILLGSLNFVLNREGISDFLAWFLMVLFYVSILFYFLQRTQVFDSGLGKVLVLIVDLGLIIGMSCLNTTTLLHFEIVPMAFLFYYLGYCAKHHDWKVVPNKTSCWIFLGPVVVAISAVNTPVAMYENNYGNIILFLIAAISGIVFVCELSKCLEKNVLLGWYGRNSIIIYVLHFSMIKILHLIGRKVFPQIAQSNYLYPFNWCYFMAIALLMVPAILFCNRFVPFLFGKVRTENKICAKI